MGKLRREQQSNSPDAGPKRKRYEFAKLEDKAPPRLQLLGGAHDVKGPLQYACNAMDIYLDADPENRTQRVKILDTKLDAVIKKINNVLNADYSEDGNPIEELRYAFSDLKETIMQIEDAGKYREQILYPIKYVELMFLPEKECTGIINIGDVFADIREVHEEAKIISVADAQVLSARSEMQRAIANLIYNATVHAGATEVFLDSSVIDSSCIITVEDNGRGMSEEKATEITARTFSYLKTDEEPGLGLLLVRNTIREAGGTIEMETAEGAGTRFTLTLPIVEQD